MRRPGRAAGLYDSGHEPDARFTLANERTFLAWCRTSIGMLAAALAADAFLAESSEPWKSVAAGGFAVLGALCTVTAYRRWRATESSLRHDRPLPRFEMALPMMCVLLLLFVLGVIALFAPAHGG